MTSRTSLPPLNGTSETRNRSRWRLLVVQVLMLSLFLTLFARLWYLQVDSGQTYRAAAANQSIRDVVVQPARGLVVDDQGRPLVANRTSWQITLDRNLYDKMSTVQQHALLTRLSHAVSVRLHTLKARSLICGEAGSKAGTCWNGSPFQPIPLATNVSQRVAVAVMERPEDYPAVLAQSVAVRAYPSPFGVNAAHLLGYLSPITAGEYAHAQKTHDRSLNAASEVGRDGLEREYDKYLRGMPGYKRVVVDSMGRVLGDSGQVPSRPGDTLVTSIDAKVQAVVEKQLKQTIMTARHTVDPVTGRDYKADSGAAIVMDAHNGRLVAMASYPTYNPKVWVGGITSKELKHLYSAKAGTPLLSRPTQGEFAPGSTWKPMMSIGALNHGFTPNSRLDCSSGLMVGNRLFKNYESESYGYISFAKALQVSCDTFFYRVGLSFWQRFGSNPTNVHAYDPLVREAQQLGFGRPTGVDLPGESSGRIASRQWKLAYYKAMKGYYCKIAAQGGYDYLHVFAHDFCVEGNYYRAGDAVNFAIGQGDTVVTPLQLARAYAALANGGTLYEPRIATAAVSPSGQVVKRFPPVVAGHVKSKKSVLKYIDTALKGTPVSGTLAWKFGGFPLGQVPIRGKTGTAEVFGKQTTSWVATYTKDYVVLMMVSQGGTGSGTSGPAVRKIWETLYGIHGLKVNPADAAIPGTELPSKLPVFAKDGAILPPVIGRSRGGSR